MSHLRHASSASPGNSLAIGLRRVSGVAVVVAATAILSSAALAQAPPGYTIQTLNVPGAVNTAALGVNGSGQVVGHYLDASTSLLRGFRLSDGNFGLIDFPASGEKQTEAFGINQTGQIVGKYVASFTSHGFFLDTGNYTPINVSTTANTHGAFGINRTRQIVGGYSDGAGAHGFLLNAGVFTPINFPGAVGGTQANGINDRGQIVGTYYADNTGNVAYGFLLSEGRFTAIAFPGSVNTQALGINNSGDVVGLYFDSAGRFHGFVRDAKGVFSTFDVPGAFVTAARGINDRGQIVGNFADGLGGHGFLATPAAPIDTDGDGVPDSSDRCPTTFGERSNHGCPTPPGDRDGDGIPDSRDACPDVYGERAHNGCPPPRPATRDLVLERASYYGDPWGSPRAVFWNVSPRALITNLGPETATSFSVEFEFRGAPGAGGGQGGGTSRVSVRELAPRESIWVVPREATGELAFIRLYPGAYIYSATVDSLNQVAETNELNNVVVMRAVLP